ncbi:hypothetical protein B6U91_01055 [Candidatus Pacearchaeota archaeon ex4484_71]|nr:MAG: hypothetical protein B6U91_01055 [Candidatus Pacearchaeota archaeon ex4484_71]
MTSLLQKKLEEKTYEILFELEDEFDLDLKSLPEVYYVGRNFNPYEVGLPIRLDFSLKKTALFFPKYNVIFTATKDEGVLGEEVGHFIHHQFLHKRHIKEVPLSLEHFGMGVVREAIGFFCSKLIDPKRRSQYKKDNFLFKKSLEGVLRHIRYIAIMGEYEHLIHQQGYLIGEKMYQGYLSGGIDIGDVKEVLQKPLKGKNEAFYEFIKLRQRFVGGKFFKQNLIKKKNLSKT